MSKFEEIGLALRLLRRDMRAGEVTLLLVAIVIAAASLTTVGFFADRVRLALAQQSNQLLGADLTIVSDRPFDGAFERVAVSRGLTVTRALRFPSMVMAGEESLLSDIKAVAAGYPLRGQVKLTDHLFGAERVAQEVPAPGTAWVDDRLLTRLALNVGDRVQVGRKELRIAAIITQEPDSTVGFINSAPRLLMHEDDLAASALIQTGSRVRYRLYVAGETVAVDDYRAWAQQHIAPGQSIEGIRDARPEIRSALERAEKYLGLAALLSVILSAVAIALAARRFLDRHLDGCAVMRCLGASQSKILRLYTVHFMAMGALAATLGCFIGYVSQATLGMLLGKLIATDLPWPGLMPAGQGFVAGLLLLLGFALPPLASLGRVPPARVLRRDLGVPRGWGAVGHALAAGVIATLVLWQARDLALGLYVLAGVVAVALVSTAIMVGALRALSGVRARGGAGWRYGIANLQRRALGNSIQIVALALGIMALLTLTLIRGDLLKSWQGTLRPDTPNRFVINIQPDQLQAIQTFMAEHGLEQPPVYPMVRGRLVEINGRPVSSDDYSEDRAKRLIDREFNLSWAQQLQSGTRIVAGSWWNAQEKKRDQLSVEQGLAQTLGIRLGDRLTYEVAGSRWSAAVTSLRKVDWDSFQVNFFVLAPPGLLEGGPASYITSFYLPSGQVSTLNSLVREFPNLVVIDVAQIMAQVQKMVDQISMAVQFIFLFTLAAGLLVLYTALASTRDERVYEAAVMRTLGASGRQLFAMQIGEFVLIGACAGLLAAAGATALGHVLALKVMNVPFLGNPWIWPIGCAGGALGVAIAGALGTRKVAMSPPLQSLRGAA